MGVRRGKRIPAAETVAAVQQLVGSGGITKADAFKKIAEQTGRSPASVAVVFYKASAGKGKRTAAVRGRKRGAGRTRRRGSTQVSAALETLASVIRQQQAEIERLERQLQRFEHVRRLLR